MKIKYKINYAFLILFVLQCLPTLMHGQMTTFQKIYPSSINQGGQDVLPTADGGYIIAGKTENNIINDLDILINKTNNLGEIVWTKTYGGSRPDYANCILQTIDGYLILGYSQSFGGGDQDNYLLKINTVGDTLWTKVYGGYGNEDGKEIVATADGNYVIVGGSNSVNFSNNDMQLIKIDPLGHVIWTKYYGGGTTYESARSVKLCLDGGFIIAGKTLSIVNALASVYLVKINSSGDTLWTKTYSGPNSYEGKSIVVNSDGSYTLCVDDSSSTHDSDVRVMNINSSGAIVWNKSYGGTDKDICKMIQLNNDGSYIVTGISRSFGWGDPEMWLLKINTSGDTIWTANYGGPGHEHCYATRQTPDGGFISIGLTRSFSVNARTFLVKMDDLGHSLPLALSINALTSNNINLNIYPNPSNGVIHIDLSDAVNSSSTFRISNSLGQILFSEIIDPSSGIKSKIINIEDEKPGIYFVTVQSSNRVTTKKLVLN